MNNSIRGHSLKNSLFRICWFGTYNSSWGRSKIYIQGLRQLGVEILECQSLAPGLQKYVELFRKHKNLSGKYDALVVGYPSHSVVWFAKLLSSKIVVFDALCTMYEGVVLSRQNRGFWGLKAWYIKFIDWLAVKCADIVLVESEAQRKYFVEQFGQSPKYKVVYTGADDSVFFVEPEIKKREKFTALFRGKLLPEAGMKHIIKSAKILEEKGVNFLIIGNGWQEEFVKVQVESCKLGNLELITENLSNEDLRKMMLACHISLGQFEKHERLSRTIPHKCFESLALGLPYITARTEPVAEILKEAEEVVFANPADPQDLADKILYLKNNPDLLSKLSENGRKIFQEKFTPKVLADQILKVFS